MAEPAIVIDHMAGRRRGQRAVFRVGDTVRFGRHPDSDVCFDANRDIAASSRHAELEPGERGYVLRDVGSSNGTFVAGARVIELEVALDEPVIVEFGDGGPRVRVYVGDPERAPPVPSRARTRLPLPSRRSRVLVAVALAVVAVALALGAVL